MVSQLVEFPGPGCVVEFLQGNAPQIAWVMEEQGAKLRLMLPNRRETTLGANRLLPWSGPRHDAGKSRDEVVALLLAHKEKRERLEADTNPVELWELAQGEVDKASALWLAELAHSDPDADAVAACGHALLACKTHFRFQPPNFEVYDAETVEARRQAEEAQRERDSLVAGGAEWFRRLWESRVNHKPAPAADAAAPPEPVRSRLARLLRARIVDPDTQDDEALWKQVSKGLPDDLHLPLLLAETWGLVPPHYNYWLERADYEPGDAWCDAFAEEIRALTGRTAALDAPAPGGDFVSIDSATTRDIDDAFSIEPRPQGGWKVAVALACPALGWPFGGALDRAVAHRATSIYLPEADYHMMPECLGTDAYSLLAGQPRPAFVLRCEVDADGTLTGGAPELARVALRANLSYPACEAVLTGAAGDGNPAAPYAEALRQGMALAESRLRKRVEQGAVVIERPDADFYLVGQGGDVRVFLKETPPAPKAQLLVSELMILANAALAAWGREHGVPLLHRTQDVAVPREFAGVWSAAPDIARVVRALAPASLEATARPHAGMGLSAYSPVTSPLRRYPDLVNEAQVLAWLETGAPRWSETELKALLTQLNPRLDAAGQVQRHRPRYWKFLYLQQESRAHGDECPWRAVVAEENDAYVSISLPREQLIVRGKRSLFGEKVFPGQELRVRLGKINALRGEISILAVREA